jgi:hypothetical protein
MPGMNERFVGILAPRRSGRFDIFGESGSSRESMPSIYAMDGRCGPQSRAGHPSR